MKSLKEALVHKHMDHYRDFTKKDLQEKDIVITRHGRIMQLKYSELYKENTFNWVAKTSRGSCWMDSHLEWYDDNLNHIGMPGVAGPNPNSDIMEVYRCNLDLPIDLKEHKELKRKLDKMRPIWERK